MLNIRSKIRAFFRSKNVRNAIKKILSRDSAIIIIASIFLSSTLLFLQHTAFSPVLLSFRPFEERIFLHQFKNGALKEWTAEFDLRDIEGTTRRSFSLQLADLLPDTPCPIQFSINPVHSKRTVQISVDEVFPQTTVEVESHTAPDWVGLGLNYSGSIENITLTVTFSQPTVSRPVPLPYGRVVYETEVECGHGIPLSKLCVITPSFLTVDQAEPSREIARVYYLGGHRVIEFEPQRSVELAVVELVREPSSLIPLLLNFVSLLSIVNLVYALSKSLIYREHRIVMISIGVIVASLWVGVLWIILAS